MILNYLGFHRIELDRLISLHLFELQFLFIEDFGPLILDYADVLLESESYGNLHLLGLL